MHVCCMECLCVTVLCHQPIPNIPISFLFVALPLLESVQEKMHTCNKRTSCEEEEGEGGVVD